MSTQQEAFEAWAGDRYWFDSMPGIDTEYLYSQVQEHWLSWQAAQAAMPVAAVRVPMTREQADALETGWFRKVSDGRMAFIRAIEVHHGIGGKS